MGRQAGTDTRPADEAHQRAADFEAPVQSCLFCAGGSPSTLIFSDEHLVVAGFQVLVRSAGLGPEATTEDQAMQRVVVTLEQVKETKGALVTFPWVTRGLGGQGRGHRG